MFLMKKILRENSRLEGKIQELPCTKGATVVGEDWSWLGNMTARGESTTQGSCQKFTKWPCPITHLAPRWRAGRCWRICFQIQDPKEDELEMAWKSPWGMYLGKNQDANRLCDARALQASRRKQPSLTSTCRLIPNPPSILRWQTRC